MLKISLMRWNSTRPNPGSRHDRSPRASRSSPARISLVGRSARLIATYCSRQIAADDQRGQAEQPGNVVPHRRQQRRRLRRHGKGPEILALVGDGPLDIGAAGEQPGAQRGKPGLRSAVIGSHADTARSPDAAVRLDVLYALARALDALRHRGPIGELPLQGGVRLDAEQLVLQQPDDDVGGILIDLSSVAIGPQQRQRRRNEETGKGDGHDPQRQRPFEIETRRCDGFHSHQGAFHCEGPLRTSMLHAPPVQGKQPAHRRAICPGRQAGSARCLAGITTP